MFYLRPFHNLLLPRPNYNCRLPRIPCRRPGQNASPLQPTCSLCAAAGDVASLLEKRSGSTRPATTDRRSDLAVAQQETAALVQAAPALPPGDKKKLAKQLRAIAKLPL